MYFVARTSKNGKTDRYEIIERRRDAVSTFERWQKAEAYCVVMGRVQKSTEPQHTD